VINFIISNSLILFINLVYIHLLLTQKRSIKYTSFVFIISYLGVVLVGYFLLKYFQKDVVNYKYLLYILASSIIIYIYLVYEESLAKKIFTLITMWLFSNVILIICSNIINLFFLEKVNLYIFPFSLSRIFIELIFFPIIYLYLRGPYKKMLKLVSNKVINIMSFYSIIIFLFLIYTLSI
jgi:two-component system, LytTR family, sensor histidine kinase AgrC